MHRIELYVDGNKELTIDIYYNVNDEYYVKRLKGNECSNFMDILCSYPILSVHEKSNGQDVALGYEEYILNINEYEEIFKYKETLLLKLNLGKYYNDVARHQIVKSKKVVRRNKYANERIIASSLTLLILGSAFVNELLKKDFTQIDLAPQISYTQSEDSTLPFTNLIYENSSQEEILKDSVVNLLDYSNGTNNQDNLLIEDSINNSKNEGIDVFISYEDRSDTEKARITKAYYGEVIKKYSRMYGLDPKILTAIATQERGIHSETKDSGGATGLMQIQNSVWVGQKLTAYNYETNSYETVIVNESDLSDVFCNIKYGCMIFQNAMDYMDDNVLAAIQCYNMGYGNMMKIFKAYSADTGKTIEEILMNVSDCDWLAYRDIIQAGDQLYLEHVLSWIGSEININNSDMNAVDVNLNIHNKNNIKSMSFN